MHRIRQKAKQLIAFLIIFTFLFFCPAPPIFAKNPPLRPANITALVDQDDWKQDKEGRKQEIQEIITFVSTVFEKEFGLTLILGDIKPYGFPNENKEINTTIAISDIQQTIDYETSDLVLGFTNKKLYQCVILTTEEMELYLSLLLSGQKDAISCTAEKRIYANGIANTPGKIALVTLTEFSKFIAVHEVGHNFGMEHFHDGESIANPVISDKTVTFNDANKEIIKQRIKEKFSIQSTP